MKSFTQTIHIIAVALLIGWGVSAVSAWTTPTVNPPATGTVKSPSGDTAKAVSAAINVTGFDQIKQGGFIIDPKITPAINSKGSFISPLSFFKKTLLPNDDTAVYVGGVGSADPDFTTQFPGSRTIPLTVNLAGRGNNNAIKFIADNAEQCPTGTKISTDSSAFQFWNEGGSKNADLLAKGIRLTGGNPAKGKILISVDNDGRAVWATPKLAANGKDIIFDTTTSPVGSCTTPTPNPNPTCPAGTTGTPPNCVPIVTDLCFNITGIQNPVPAGYDLLPGKLCKKWWDVTIAPGNPGESCKSWMTRNGINTNPNEFRVVRKASTTTGLSPILDASNEPGASTYWLQQVFPNECLYENNSVRFATYGTHQYAHDTQKSSAENPSITMKYVNAQNTTISYQYNLLPRNYRPVATFTQHSSNGINRSHYDNIENLDRSILRQEGVSNLLSGNGGGVLGFNNNPMILQEYR